ncbi:MAG: hypothetical protein AAF713_19080 [Pseudomonadota bacterium]
MASEIHYQDKSFTVTATSFRTPRRTFLLRQVEQTSLRRPAVVALLAFWGTCAALAWVFADILLYDHEIWVLLGGPALALPFAAQIGVLGIEYRGMGGAGRVVGSVSRLAKVRHVIDELLDTQSEAPENREARP